MPLYEFECTECGYVEEKMTGFKITVLPCSKCKGKAVRIMSVSNFVIKGYSESNGYSKSKR